MKRFWLIMFLSIIIFVTIGVNNGLFGNLLLDIGGVEYTYYVATYKDLGINCKRVEDLKIYDLGNNVDFLKWDDEDIVAEIIEFEKSSYDMIKYFKNLKCVLVEELEDVMFIYLYDSSLPKILEVKGVCFNLQVAVSNNIVKVGYPCMVDTI